MKIVIRKIALRRRGAGALAIAGGRLVLRIGGAAAKAEAGRRAAAAAVPVSVAVVEPRRPCRGTSSPAGWRRSSASRSARASPAPCRRSISAKARWSNKGDLLGHDRSGALRRRGRRAPRRRSRRPRRPADPHQGRARARPAAVGARSDLAARARRAHQRPARGRGQPARRRRPRCRRRKLNLGYTAGARAGRRPRRQARDHRRQPGRRRAGRAGADHAGVGQPDLCQLQRRRAGGGARAARRSAGRRRRRPSSTASRCRWAPPPADGTPYRGPAAADRQPGRCAAAARCACAPCSTIRTAS